MGEAWRSGCWSLPAPSSSPCRPSSACACWCSSTTWPAGSVDSVPARERLGRRLRCRLPGDGLAGSGAGSGVRSPARVVDLAHRDALTGSYNRRFLDQRLRQLHEGGTAFPALVDLDNFKQLNDVYGHAGGDAALCRCVELGQTLLGEGLTVPLRWRGWWPLRAALAGRGRAADGAVALPAQRNRNGGRRDAGHLQRRYRHQPGTIPEVLIALVDKAMYQAKRAGKEPHPSHRGRHGSESVCLPPPAHDKALATGTGPCPNGQPATSARWGRPSRGGSRRLALVDAENGHGLGQAIDGFLMFLPAPSAGSPFGPELLHLGQPLGAERQVLWPGASSIFFMSMGTVEGEGAGGEEQSCQQQRESHLDDLHDGIPLRIASQKWGRSVEVGKKQTLP